MLKPFFLIFNLLTFSILFFFTSCEKTENANPKELRTAFKADPQTLDTRKSFDFITSSLHFLLYSGLTEIKPDGKTKLNLAQSYTLSKDGTKYTFYLKKAFWSDGTQITAYDFERSWKEALTPPFFSATSALFYPIKNAKKAALGQNPLKDVGIKALDETTLAIELEKPTPYFLHLTAFSCFFPMPSKPNQGQSFSGPFTLKSWQRGHEMVLVKNQRFWNQHKVFLNQIKIQIIDNAFAALALFEKDRLNFISSHLCPLPIENLIFQPENKLRKLTWQNIAATAYLTFNCEKKALKNKTFRKKLSFSIDRIALVEKVTQAQEQPAFNITPPCLYQTLANNKIIRGKEYFQQYFLQTKTDFEKISKNNFIYFEQPLTLMYENSPFHKKIAEFIQAEWQKKLGLKIQLLGCERSCFFHNLKQKNYNIALTSIIAQYPHPSSFLERFAFKTHFKNYTLWENPKFKKILQKQKLFLTDFLKLEKILINEMAIAPLYHHSYLVLQKPYVKNVKVGLIGDLHLENIYFEQ